MDRKKLLKGVIDIHVHAGPSVAARELDAADMLKEAEAAGDRGFLVKDHYFPSMMGCQMVQRHLGSGSVEVFGSMCLNNAMGLFNLNAVDVAYGMGAKMIYFPTVSSKNHIDAHKGHFAGAGKMSVPETPVVYVDENGRLDPAAVRKKLSAVLKRAGCPAARFHDLRHTFATSALEHGMDVKTLSTVIGHVSSATTLNTYAHITDTMKQKAADKIDRAITGTEPPHEETPKPLGRTAFQPVKGKYRKPGTGCISQINGHLWEGRYSPKVNGKRMARNVYATTEAECEAKLAELIREMKAEIAALQTQSKAS